MKTLETIATGTPDGQITFPAPAGLSEGKHRVKVEIDEQKAVEPTETPPKPKRYYKGRPVYDKEDLKHMKNDLPPEHEWKKELGIGRASRWIGD